MYGMDIILIVCVIIVTLAVTAAVVYLVLTLIQVRRTARQVEILVTGLNREMDAVGRITAAVSSFATQAAGPWMKVGGWLSGILISFLKNRARTSSSDSQGEPHV